MKAKMKLTRLLALALLMALALPAWALAAQDALVARKGLDGFEASVDSICAVYDVVWMCGWQGVYAYDAAAGDMTAYPFTEAWSAAAQGVYDPERGETVYQGILAWFSWNGGVYALVNTANGQGMIDARLCALTVNERGEADFETVGTIDWQSLENDSYVQIDSCCVVNDVLCAVSWVGDQRLCFIPLDGSCATVTEVPCSQLCPCEGGVLAVEETWDSGETEYVFYQVEVPSGRKTALTRFTPEEGQVE
ncbi:MAG: hypothetical protein IJ048_07045, partial [Clostridia bacterium]|nr:hypothetical protein [Clostridia bacterium]